MKQKIKIILWMAADFIIVISGIYIAFLIRYLGVIPAINFIPFTKIWYLFGIVSAGSLFYFGLYNQKSEMSKKELMIRSLKAIVLANLIMIDIAYVIREQIMRFPSSIFILGTIINTLLCSGWRIFILYDNEEEKK